MLNIGWFSSGRDQAAIDLLRVVSEAIDSKIIDGKISFVFVTREIEEKPESDRFIDYAEGLGLKVITLSHRDFEPELRKKGIEDTNKLGADSPALMEWRTKYDKAVIQKLNGHNPDLVVLAGYMLILSPLMCGKYNIINLHPALPGGPKGTWQEVIWQLMESSAKKTGVMMHLITPELDAGPAITYCEFSIYDDDMKPLWDCWIEKREKATLEEIQKREGEDEPLFREIRKRGLMREFPIIVATLKSAADGDFEILKGEVLSKGKRLDSGFDLTDKIEKDHSNFLSTFLLNRTLSCLGRKSRNLD